MRSGLPDLIAEALATGDLAGAVAEVEPGCPKYRRLESALQVYRALAAQGPAPPLPGRCVPRAVRG